MIAAVAHHLHPLVVTPLAREAIERLPEVWNLVDKHRVHATIFVEVPIAVAVNGKIGCTVIVVLKLHTFVLEIADNITQANAGVVNREEFVEVGGNKARAAVRVTAVGVAATIIVIVAVGVATLAVYCFLKVGNHKTDLLAQAAEHCCEECGILDIHLALNLIHTLKRNYLGALVGVQFI